MQKYGDCDWECLGGTPVLTIITGAVALPVRGDNGDGVTWYGNISA